LRYLPNFRPNQAEFDEAREHLAAIGCESLADKPFGVLSQGERQQVLFARATMVDPILLVLDEPCGGMDPGVRERFLAWLDSELAKGDGPATLLVTHHVEEIMPSIERTLVMRDGRIERAGPKEEVVTHSVIESAYSIRLAELRESGGRKWPIWQTSERGP
jgi:iron complex transport system ATP-binding protein